MPFGDGTYDQGYYGDGLYGWGSVGGEENPTEEFDQPTPQIPAFDDPDPE